MTIHYSPDFGCWWIKNSGGIIIAEFPSKEKASKYLQELLLRKYQDETDEVLKDSSIDEKKIKKS